MVWVGIIFPKLSVVIDWKQGGSGGGGRPRNWNNTGRPVVLKSIVCFLRIYCNMYNGFTLKEYTTAQLGTPAHHSAAVSTQHNAADAKTESGREGEGGGRGRGRRKGGRESREGGRDNRERVREGEQSE